MAFRQNRNQVSFSRGGKRRLTEWSLCTSATGFSNISPASKATLVLFPSTIIDPISPATIVRSRIELAVASDQVAATEVQVGAFGVGFVNAVAGTLGVAGIPGPATDCDWGGWFVHQFFNQEFVFGTAVGLHPDFATRYSIDSKAMRKFHEAEVLVMMIENLSASDGIRVAVSGRFLVKAG